MNAHAKISRVSTLMPECTDAEEQDVRERLLTARDIATRELARKYQSPAAPLMQVMCEVAGEWAFAPQPIERLRAAREVCLELMRCIARVEELADSHD